MKEITSRTETLLQSMVETHRPDCFIFGHHHKRADVQIGLTEYHALSCLDWGKLGECIFEIPEIKWE